MIGRSRLVEACPRPVTGNGEIDSETGIYNVRIAYPAGGGMFSTGASYVGYVDLPTPLSGSDALRARLVMVDISGYWGKKVVNGVLRHRLFRENARGSPGGTVRNV